MNRGSLLVALAMMLAIIPVQGQGRPAPYRGPHPTGAMGAVTAGPFSARAGEEGRVTFSSFSDLVLVPVIVTDKAGVPIHGLTREDFTLAEDGKKRRIATFEEVTPVTGLPATPARPAGYFTNVLPGGTQPPRLTIIAIDTINTPLLEQAQARRQLLQYLARSLHPGQLISLLYFDRAGVHVLHDFTSDTASLIVALKQLTGQVPVQVPAGQDSTLPSPSAFTQFLLGESHAAYQSNQLENAVEQTLKAFLSLAQAFRGVPGRKSLVWVTASFPLYVDGPSFIPGLRLGPLYESTFQALNDADIAIYPVDARGLVTLFGNAAGSTPVTLLQDQGFLNVPDTVLTTHQDSIATLQQIAEMTGGRAFYDRNDLANALQQVESDSAAYYLLGYYLDHSNTRPGWRTLKVKVDRKNSRVRVRAGFYVTPATANPETTRALDMLNALASPLDDTALPLVVRWTDVSGAGPRKTVTFTVSVPARDLAIDPAHQNQISLDFGGEAKTPKAMVAAHFGRNILGHVDAAKLEQFRQVDFTYRDQMELPPGQYLVRFAVRDNLSGKLGSVSAALTVH